MVILDLIDEKFMDKGTYLCSNTTMLINPSLAFLLGDSDSAIILQQLHYWLETNKTNILMGKEYTKNGKKIPNMYRDGRIWTFNTFEDWEQEFIWISLSSIKRKMAALEKLGVVLSSDKYNAYTGDRTKWYTIDYQKLAELEDGINSKLIEKKLKIEARKEKQKQYNAIQNSKSKAANRAEQEAKKNTKINSETVEPQSKCQNETMAKCQDETMAECQNETMAKCQSETMAKCQNESLINNRLTIPKTNIQEINLQKTNLPKTTESIDCQSVNQSQETTSEEVRLLEEKRIEMERQKEEMQHAEFILYDMIKIQEFRGSSDEKLIKEIGLNIVEMFMQETTTVQETARPKVLVQSVLSKLTQTHIQYIVDKFKESSARGRIISKKGYLQSVIYNSVYECDASYTSDVITDTYN